MILPSILEKTFESAQEKIKMFEPFSGMVQVDFVDNNLFEGLTFLDIEKLNTIDTPLTYDIHLLVANPLDFLKTKINNAKQISMQVEAWEYVDEFILKTKELGYKVGLSLGPETAAAKIDPYLDKIDFVQFMTIVPGGQGRKFIPEIIEKIRDFKQKYPKMVVQADGAIDENTLPMLAKVGVNNFSVGHVLINALNPSEKFLQLTNMQTQITSLAPQQRHERKVVKIAILGGAAWKETDQAYIDAFNTTKLLAENGYGIVNGGGPGVMRAATKGAHAGGGRALAITYHPNKPKRHYEGVDLENDFDDEIITLDYFDRTKVMLQTTQMHIVFRGSIGTLSEFGMTWVSSWIHEPDNKPIILFGDFWHSLLEEFRRVMLLEKHEEGMLKICTTPEQVLEYVQSLDKD